MAREYDLEERLLLYAASIIRLTEDMRPTRAGSHVAGQLLRAGTSPLFNHGEAEGAESTRDFSHKLSICIKELKECRRALKLVTIVPLIDDVGHVMPLLAETEELIRIFGAAIRTTRSRMTRESPASYQIPAEHSDDSSGGNEE